MDFTWSGKGKSLLLKLLLPLMSRRIMQETQTELEKFKELVETYGVDFSKSPKKSN